MQAGRNGGFAFVIGVDRTGHAEALLRCGADVVVPDLADVAVRSGDKRMSRLPNALDSYGQLIGVVGGRQPFVCLDFDGTLSEIVSDPDAATLVDGAAKALENLAARCPVAILSGRSGGHPRPGRLTRHLVRRQPRLRAGRTRRQSPPQRRGSLGGTRPGKRSDRTAREAGADPGSACRAQALRRRGPLPQRRTGACWRDRRVSPPARKTTWPAGDGRPQGNRAATGHRLGQGHRAGLDPRPDPPDGSRAADLRRRRSHRRRRLRRDSVRWRRGGRAARRGRRSPHGRPVHPEQSRRGPRVPAARRNWLAYEQQTSNEAWTFTFEGYDPHNEKLREALCTVGNGYFATRAAPESRAGQVHYPGTYAAGVYNRLDDVVAGTKTDNESLVNLPNWLPLTFRIDGGDWFDVDAVTLLSYRQTLDLRGAVLTRELRFRDDVGRTTSVTQNRFVAMHMAHVAALETTILAEDWSGTIEIRSMIDGNVRNSGVERYRELASTHLRPLNKRALSENSVSLTVETTQSQIPVALTARTTVWRDGSPAPATYGLVDEEFEIGHKIFTELAAGQSLSVEKVVTLVTGRDVATSEPAAGAERRLGRQPRFAQIRRCAHPRLGAHLGAVVDRIRRPRRRVAHPAAASAASVADGLLQQRGARHRGACTRAAWRGISRSRLLGRAVHLPGAEPAAADGHPVAASVPVPPVGGGASRRQAGRILRRDVPVAVRQ